MDTKVILFPISRSIAAHDDDPSGPGGGAAVSVATLRRYLRIVRTLRGVSTGCARPGQAVAA